MEVMLESFAGSCGKNEGGRLEGRRKIIDVDEIV
jgi:hypothetical protein